MSGTNDHTVVAHGAYLLDLGKKTKIIQGKQKSRKVPVFSEYVDEYGRSLKPHLFEHDGEKFAWFKYDIPKRGYQAEFLAPVISNKDEENDEAQIHYVVVPISGMRDVSKRDHYKQFLQHNAYPKTSPGLKYAPYEWDINGDWGKTELYGVIKPKLTLKPGETHWLVDNSSVTEQRDKHTGEVPVIKGEPVIDSYDLNPPEGSNAFELTARNPPIPQRIGEELSHPDSHRDRINYIKMLLARTKAVLETSVGHISKATKKHAVPAAIKVTKAAKTGGKAAVKYGTPVATETIKGTAKGAVKGGIEGIGEGIQERAESTEGSSTATAVVTTIAVKGATGAAIGGAGGAVKGFSKGIDKAKEIRKNEKAAKPEKQSDNTQPEPHKVPDPFSDEDDDEDKEESEEESEEEINPSKQALKNSERTLKISAQIDGPMNESSPVPVSVTESYIEKTKANIANQQEQSQSPQTPTNAMSQPNVSSQKPAYGDYGTQKPEPDMDDSGANQGEQDSETDDGTDSQQSPNSTEDSPYAMWTDLKPWPGYNRKLGPGRFPDKFVEVPEISQETFKIPPNPSKDFEDVVINPPDNPKAFEIIDMSNSATFGRKIGSEYHEVHHVNYPEMFRRHQRPNHVPHVARLSNRSMLVVIRPHSHEIRHISAEAKQSTVIDTESDDDTVNDEKTSIEPIPGQNTAGTSQKEYFKEHPVKFFDKDVCRAQGFPGDCLDRLREYRKQQLELRSMNIPAQ